jgi:hypothetical protein
VTKEKKGLGRNRGGLVFLFCSEDLSTRAFLITQTICSSCRCACEFGELHLGIIIRVGFVATAVCILRGISWGGVFIFLLFFGCSVAVVALQAGAFCKGIIQVTGEGWFCSVNYCAQKKKTYHKRDFEALGIERKDR